MSEQQIVQSSAYAQSIAELVATMSVERAAQVYDFARFLLSQPEQTLPSDSDSHTASEQQNGLLDDDGWLNDSENQMQAEDAQWDATHTRHADKFKALAEAARAEIQAGTTQPMFDTQGELVADELPNHT